MIAREGSVWCLLNQQVILLSVRRIHLRRPSISSFSFQHSHEPLMALTNQFLIRVLNPCINNRSNSDSNWRAFCEPNIHISMTRTHTLKKLNKQAMHRFDNLILLVLYIYGRYSDVRILSFTMNWMRTGEMRPMRLTTGVYPPANHQHSHSRQWSGLSDCWMNSRRRFIYRIKERRTDSRDYRTSFHRRAIHRTTKSLTAQDENPFWFGQTSFRYTRRKQLYVRCINILQVCI